MAVMLPYCRQRICMEDVITGQEFSRATNMPARWLVEQASDGMLDKISLQLSGGPRYATGLCHFRRKSDGQHLLPGNLMRTQTSARLRSSVFESF